jgi:hypothetical protein
MKSSILAVINLLCYKELLQILHMTSHVHAVLSEISIQGEDFLNETPELCPEEKFLFYGNV